MSALDFALALHALRGPLVPTYPAGILIVGVTGFPPNWEKAAALEPNE